MCIPSRSKFSHYDFVSLVSYEERRNMRILAILLPALLILLLGSGDLYACAVCDGATPEPVRQAYNYSTAWLSFVPLIFMASVGFYIYRLVKRAKVEQ